MSRRKDLIETLGTVGLFARCTKRELGTVARHVETVDLADGTEMIVQGGPGDALFVILEGSATIERDGVEVGTAEAGDHFGELALLDGEPRSATVRAVGPITVAVLGVRMFRTLLREFPDIAEQLLSAMARELRDARGQ